MRCKPGDLAVIIDAFNRSNIGRIVKVVGRHDGRGTLAMASSPNVWLVHCAQPLTWTIDAKRYRRKNGPAPDAQLQPIRGDAVDSLVMTSLKSQDLEPETCAAWSEPEDSACATLPGFKDQGLKSFRL